MWLKQVLLEEAAGGDDGGGGGSGEALALESKGTPEQQTEARNVGWIPPEEFRGPAEKFVDAPEFLERAEHVMPIMRENNKKLNTTIANQNSQIAALKAEAVTTQESVKALTDFWTKEIQRRVVEERNRVTADLKQARVDGDVDAEIAASNRLTELKVEEANAATDAKTKVTETRETETKTVDHSQNPEFIQWRAENPWFGTDIRRTRLMQAISAEMRATDQVTVGKAFLDKVLAEVNKTIGSPPRRGPGKVDEGGGLGRTASGAKGFASLPKEARDACHGYNNQLVGKGKAYKTVGDWEAAYAKTYFESEQ